jgi:hypothetical protein
MNHKLAVAIGDLHCGAWNGLTPPDWQANQKSEEGKLQNIYWKTYFDNIPKNADVLMCLGDLIDGKGVKSGGTEQQTADRLEQCDIAVACIHAARPKKIVMNYGTPYHTGKEEDFEDVIACKLKALGYVVDIGAHETVDVNGVIFDIKHKVGSSSIPHGRHTAIARERLWNVLWSQRSQRELADVILRAHVHYHQFAGDATWMGATLPALQGLGSKYGGRECSGIVDFGFLVFKVGSSGHGRAGNGAAGQGGARQGKGFLLKRKNCEMVPYIFDFVNVAASSVVV